MPRNHQNDSESLEKSFQNRSREKLRASKIDSESVVGPSWDASWQPRAFRERLGSVSGHPRRVPGAPQEPPKAPRDVRKSAREHMRERRGDQNQRQVVSWSGKTKFLSRGSCAKQQPSHFSSIFWDFLLCCEVCEPLKVLRLLAKTKVRPFALRVKSLARCNLEKPLKSVPRSTRNRRKSHLGASRAPFSVDFGRSKQLGRATQSDSGRFERLGE